MTEPTDYYAISFSADPVQLVFFRHGLDRWLSGLRWPESERVDAVLAIAEACGNAVEHAYPVGEPGDVEVTGRVVLGRADRHLVVVVRDRGRWRQDGGDGGYGLTTVRACMERVRIRHDEHGTVVTMASRSVPLVAATAPLPRQSSDEGFGQETHDAEDFCPGEHDTDESAAIPEPVIDSAPRLRSV